MSGGQKAQTKGDHSPVTQVDGNNNGTIIVNAPLAPHGEPDQPYEEKSRRLLPLTERGLQAVSAVLTIASAGWAWHLLHRVGKTTTAVAGDIDWAPIILGVLFGVAAIGWTLAFVARRRHMKFSRFAFLPTLAGVTDPVGTRRLALLRLTGNCQRCGAKLWFKNIPTKWIDTYNPQTGATKRKVTERRPAAVCSRNPQDHAWPTTRDLIDAHQRITALC